MGLFSPAWMTKDIAKYPKALKAIQKADPGLCIEIARKAPLVEVRRTAVHRLKDEDTLVDIALNWSDTEVREAAIETIEDSVRLHRVYDGIVERGNLQDEDQQRLLCEIAKKSGMRMEIGLKSCIKAALQIEDPGTAEGIMRKWPVRDVEVYIKREDDPKRFFALNWAWFGGSVKNEKARELLAKADADTIESVIKGGNKDFQRMAAVICEDCDLVCDAFARESCREYVSPYDLSTMAQRMLTLDSVRGAVEPTRAEKMILSSKYDLHSEKAQVLKRLEERNIGTEEFWKNWFADNLYKKPGKGFRCLKALARAFQACAWDAYLPIDFFRVLKKSDFVDEYASYDGGAVQFYNLKSVKDDLKNVCERCYRTRPDLRGDILALDNWRFFAGSSSESINFGGSGDDALWCRVGEDNPVCSMMVTPGDGDVVTVSYK